MYVEPGLPLVREKSGKFKVSEKSGNFRICQGNLEFCWKSGKFKKSQGNLRKFIFYKRFAVIIWHIQQFSARAFGTRIIFFNAFHSKFAFIQKDLIFETCTKLLLRYIIIWIYKYLDICMFDWSGKNADKSGKGQGKVGEFWYLVWVAILWTGLIIMTIHSFKL